MDIPCYPYNIEKCPANSHCTALPPDNTRNFFEGCMCNKNYILNPNVTQYAVALAVTQYNYENYCTFNPKVVTVPPYVLQKIIYTYGTDRKPGLMNQPHLVKRIIISLSILTIVLCIAYGIWKLQVVFLVRYFITRNKNRRPVFDAEEATISRSRDNMENLENVNIL